METKVMQDIMIQPADQIRLNAIGDFKPNSIYNDYIKRAIDFILALILAVILSPVMLIIAILIKIDSNGGVFYRGVRIGYHGEPFKIFKFRSMVANADKIGCGVTSHNDLRITKVGSFLRKTKLDEIPQVFNIITGHMSFIGPRPEIKKYTDCYEGIEKIILNVRPGITDLSSIQFINQEELVGSTNAEEFFEKYILKQKNELRVEYVLKQSFLLDMQIFFSTIWRVINKALRILFKQG